VDTELTILRLKILRQKAIKLYLRLERAYLTARIMAIRLSRRAKLKAAGFYWQFFMWLFGFPAFEDALCRAGAQMVEQDRQHVKYTLMVGQYARLVFNLRFVR